MILSKLSRKKKIILSLVGIGVLTAIPFLIKNINKKSIPKKLNFWSNATLKGSKITDGYKGTFFQDEFKNLWAIGYNSKLEVLAANENGKSYVNTGWTNDVNLGLTKNSNIKDASEGFIFQDKFKNLWSAGNNSKLQVLKANSNGNGYVDSGWINDNSKNDDNLLKNSNIDIGQYGRFFQDSFGNLWAMGNGTKLQVLRIKENGTSYDLNTGWISDNTSSGNTLLKNSNIENGLSGTIFQDKFKNLWTMGNISSLQVLKVNKNGNGYVEEGWNNDNSKNGDNLLKNSNITNGKYGTIFQDSFGNLWAMGNNQKLQVLRLHWSGNGYVEEGWINDNSSSGNNLLKNSNITNGENGIFFQDKFKNFWTIGGNSSLQVLKVNKNGNRYVDLGWTDDNSKNGDNLLKNLNINIWDQAGTTLSGVNGTIFQDSFKNLWIMGKDSKLHVLKINQNGDDYVKTGWINDINLGLTKNSNIMNGDGGTIFQDFFGNLWSMANGSKLQVLKVNKNKTGYLELWES